MNIRKSPSDILKINDIAKKNGAMMATIIAGMAGQPERMDRGPRWWWNKTPEQIENLKKQAEKIAGEYGIKIKPKTIAKPAPNSTQTPKVDERRATGLLEPTEEERNSIPAGMPSNLNPNGIPSAAWNAPQSGYGSRIGQPAGTINTMDFRDSDKDGTDDRYQTGPGQPRGGDKPAVTPPNSKIGFPDAWGTPPRIQTRDRVTLPMGGMGSSTMKNWQLEKMKQFGTPPNSPSQTKPAGGNSVTPPMDRLINQAPARPPEMPIISDRDRGETISSKPSWEAVGMTQKEWEDAGRPSKGDKIKPYSQRAKADIFKLNEKLNDALKYSEGRTSTSVKLIQNQIAERNDITKALSSGLTMQEAEEYAARRQKEYTTPTYGAAVSRPASERDDLQARANNGDKRAQMEVLKQQPANNFTGKSPYARTTPEEAWALEKAAASGDKKAKAEISTRLQTKDETGNHTLGMTRPALDRLHGKTDSPAIREAAELEKSGAMARTNQGGGAGWSGGSSGGSSGGAMAKPNSAAAMKFDPQSKPAATRQGLDALSPAEQTRLANENPQEYDRLKKETVAKRYADTNPRETAQQKRETAQQKKPTERKAPSQPAANQTPTLTPVGQGGGAVWSGGSKGGAMASKPQSPQPTPEQRAEQTRAIQDTQARNQLSAAKQALARNPNNLKTQADANKQIADSQRILMNNALARQQAGGANKPPAKSGGSGGGGGRSGAAPKLTAKERNAAAAAAASKLARREDSRGIADSAYRDANADSARWGESEAQREKRLTDKGMNPAYHDWKENDQSRGAVEKAAQSQWTNFNNTQKGIAKQEKLKKAADAHKKAIKDGGFTDENGVWQSSKNPDGSITDALMNNIQNLTSSAGSSSGGGSGGTWRTIDGRKIQIG